MQPASKNLLLFAWTFVLTALAALGFLYATDSWLLPTPYVARLVGAVFFYGAIPLVGLMVYLTFAFRYGYLSVACVAGTVAGVAIRLVPQLPWPV